MKFMAFWILGQAHGILEPKRHAAKKSAETDLRSFQSGLVCPCVPPVFWLNTQVPMQENGPQLVLESQQAYHFWAGTAIEASVDNFYNHGSLPLLLLFFSF